MSKTLFEEEGENIMFPFEQQISVLLEFRAMAAPVPITVPGFVLRYLDTHAERAFAPDGTVIYRHPCAPRALPELRAPAEGCVPTAA